ncbi:unnamed protein product [Protopolystoma xenopodis]|uniref:Trimethylguanosine synthase n=1 Tax=Protopolystoma xenopodis TaxID=117903 RepID=A0A3S5BGM3_9PLAT|nr:unnamed protein product [Protopolystoma xenopodis]
MKCLGKQGLFSATPEVIAFHQALRFRAAFQPNEGQVTVMDAFSGSGCNSIQLALAGFKVLALDLNPKRIEMARRNAAVYGVQNSITFICADFFKWARGRLNNNNRSLESGKRATKKNANLLLATMNIFMFFVCMYLAK